MAAESVEESLRVLTGVTGDSAEEIYGQWASLTPGDSTLEQLVKRKLVANGQTAQLRESFLGTLKAGGAIGETVPEALLRTGLTGWS